MTWATFQHQKKRISQNQGYKKFAFWLCDRVNSSNVSQLVFTRPMRLSIVWVMYQFNNQSRSFDSWRYWIGCNLLFNNANCWSCNILMVPNLKQVASSHPVVRPDRGGGGGGGGGGRYSRGYSNVSLKGYTVFCGQSNNGKRCYWYYWVFCSLTCIVITVGKMSITQDS